MVTQIAGRAHAVLTLVLFSIQMQTRDCLSMYGLFYFSPMLSAYEEGGEATITNDATSVCLIINFI